MTIYNLYIFDRTGSLVYYGEWLRKKASSMSKDEEGKLVYGMLFSLKSFVQKISPDDIEDNSFCYRTTKYKLNYYETATGLKLVMNTDLNSSPKELLKNIYSQVYVEYVAKNPLMQPGDYIHSELFIQKLNQLVTMSPIYSQRNL